MHNSTFLPLFRLLLSTLASISQYSAQFLSPCAHPATPERERERERESERERKIKRERARERKREKEKERGREADVVVSLIDFDRETHTISNEISKQDCFSIRSGKIVLFDVEGSICTLGLFVVWIVNFSLGLLFHSCICESQILCAVFSCIRRPPSKDA
jgi:hypothetical protein